MKQHDEPGAGAVWDVTTGDERRFRDFVVLLHGPATQLAARRADDNVVGGVDIERNIYVACIALQNRGYAYIPVF